MRKQTIDIFKENELYVSIESITVHKKDLMERVPSWRELAMPNFSDEEYDNANNILKNVCDDDISAPNGFHTIGKIEDLCFQDAIDKQVQNILSQSLPCQLLWFLKLRKNVDNGLVKRFK